MIDPVNTMGMFFKVIFVYMLFYVILPSGIIPFREDSKGIGDKFFISITHAHFVIILLTHILVFLKIYETFSLMLSYLALYIFAIWLAKRRKSSASTETFGMILIVRLLDISETKNWLRKLMQSIFCSCRQGIFVCIRVLTRKIICCPFEGVLLLAVFIGAAFIRFHHSFTHMYLGTSDSYLHLAWTKYLIQNDIYHDGIYPYGYQAVVAAIERVFFIDPYYVMRFLGPLAGILIVISIYYFARKNFNGTHLAWAAVLIYGMSISAELPSYIWRQISPLPMEYAIIFILPGIHFLNIYIKKRQKEFLFLAAECLAIVTFIHPYATIILTLSYSISILTNIKKICKGRIIFSLALSMIGAVSIAVLPWFTALALGKKFHESLGYVQSKFKIIQDSTGSIEKSIFMENNRILLLFFACISILILTNLLSRYKKNLQNESFQSSGAFILTTIVLYLLYRANYYGLPQVMDPVRIGIFFSPFIVIVLASPINFVDILSIKDKHKYIYKTIFCVTALYFVLSAGPFNAIPKGERYEYDEAVLAYLEIKENFPRANWTIISPVEQYQQALGYGWHYEIWEFVKNIEDNQELKIPTDYIFVFVEKVPLNSNGFVNENALEEALPAPGNNANETYYYDIKNRYNIEKKVNAWAELGMQKDDRFSVFYESDFLRVYQIEQDGKNPVDIININD